MAQFSSFDLSQAGKAQFFHPSDGTVWDGNAAAMDAYGDVTFANTLVTVAYNATLGVDTITLPATLPRGPYVIRLYDTSNPTVATEVTSIIYIEYTHDGTVEINLHVHKEPR